MGANNAAILQMLANMGSGAGSAPTGNKFLPAMLASPLAGDIAGGAAMAGIGSLLGGDDAEEEAKKKRELEEKALAQQRLMDNLQMLNVYTQNNYRRMPGGGR